MTKSIEIPDCRYRKEPILVTPIAPTPNHTLYLSNLDDQYFLRFPIRYIYVFRKSLPVDALVASLSQTLVEYYPYAGRLRSGAGGDREKLELDCNSEGAVFAEAYVDMTADQFLEAARWPNRSWLKLVYRVEGQSFVDAPPLVIQATHLSCGGMILCTVISHCLSDAIGVSQFLHAWALLTWKPHEQLPVSPVHERSILKPRAPPRIEFSHPEYTSPPPQENLAEFILSQPLVPVSITFTGSRILNIKKQVVPPIRCSSFDAVASHVWCSWVKALNPPQSLRIKLLFSVSVRKKLEPELPSGYYGNGFVLACAEASVEELITSGSYGAIKRMQEAKDRLTNGYLRSMIDLLEVRRVKPDMSSTLLISSLTRLGLDELDFGQGKPLHMSTMTSEIYCMFLPVMGDLQGFTMQMSVPQGIAESFHHHCLKDLDSEAEEGIAAANRGRGYIIE